MRSLFVSLAAFLFCMAGATAAEPERVLIPIVISGQLPGAFGSIWMTELVVRNESGESIHARDQKPPCVLAPCPVFGAPRSTFEFEHHPEVQAVGAWLYYDPPGSGTVAFNLRVQDVSRQSQTWGTQIPVVPEDAFFSSDVHLLNIPTDPRFRQALRLYDSQDTGGRQVRLRIYPNEGDTVLVDTVLTFAVPASTLGAAPPYAQLLFLAQDFPALQSHPVVRIQLTPVTAGLRYWALVTVGNNETQHVTTIFPDQIAY